MERLFFVCLALLLLNLRCFTQTFYNGSFETDSVSVCTMSLTDKQFNKNMPHVYAFGKTYTAPLYYVGKASIMDSGCTVIPVHGKWCVGLRGAFDTTSDAIAIELTSPLESGTTYYVSFYYYGNQSFRNFECDLRLGESNSDSVFGTFIHSVTATYLSWKNSSFSFVASDTSKYITVKIQSGYNSNIQVDHFVISKSPIPLGIEDFSLKDFFSLYPNPASTRLSLHFANEPEACVLEIHDVYGKTLLKKLIQEQESAIDLNYFSEGLYTIRVTNGQSSVNKKFLIAR